MVYNFPMNEKRYIAAIDSGSTGIRAFLFDKAGVLRGLSPYGQPVGALAADLGLLAAEPKHSDKTIQVATDQHLTQGNPRHVH